MLEHTIIRKTKKILPSLSYSKLRQLIETVGEKDIKTTLDVVLVRFIIF